MKDELNITDSSESTSLSKINSAALVNLTLNNLWVDYFRHLRARDYFSSNDDLDCIWTILGGEKGVEGKDDEKEYNGIQETISKLGIKPIFKEKDRQNLKTLVSFARFRQIVMKKGLFLRRLQNRQGKGTAYREEDEGDFD
jgi:hypothetical protein